MRCPHFSILAVLLLTATTAFAQNLTVQVSPLTNPTEIPPEGGTFSYQVAVTNHESTPQQVTLWCFITTPNGEQRLALQPWTASIGAGQTVPRTFTLSIPASSPIGNYIFTANIGIYPNTVWDSNQFTFYKLKPPEWVARYNGPGSYYDEAYSLAVDGSGNVYVTGSSYGNETFEDYATVKYNSAGVQEWVARYDGTGNNSEFVKAMAMDNFSNIYVTGYSWGRGTYYDYATIKYNTNGNQLWAMRYDGTGNGYDKAYSIALDSFGNVYVTGVSWEIGLGNGYATIKYDANGNQIWIAHYNGQGNSYDLATSIAVDNSGNIFVTGYSYETISNHDYATIKYDASGNQLWVARYNGPGNNIDQAISLAVDIAGNIYVTGHSRGIQTNIDYATIKYSSDGNMLWVARYNGSGNGDDEPRSLALDSFGNVYVTGVSWELETITSYVTLKYDTNGNQLWMARYNGSSYTTGDEANSLALDDSGNVFVTGYSYTSNTSSDYATIKYDTNGNQIWVARYNGSGNSYDVANSLAVDGSGNVCVTGRCQQSMYDYDFATIKYSATDLPNWQQPVATAFGAPLPTEYRLEQNYPNPFNPTTTISYQLPTKSLVKLEVFDVSGRLVTALINGWREAGSHEVTFDGAGLVSGVYLYRLTASGSGATPTMLTGKMVLLK